MFIEHTIHSLKNKLKSLRQDNSALTIGLVPTMGALHKGHESLIKESVKNNDITIVSIYVNPTQFAPSEDLDKYPRKLEDDIQICKDLNANFVFAPDNFQMYSEDELSITPPNSAFTFEGFVRNSHFGGMLQVVLKLFNITNPHNAYFGKKDAQQLFLVKKMVKDLFLDINIVGMPIVRDFDGMALSSRNVYLDSKQREIALNLSKCIFLAEKLIKEQKITQTAILKKHAQKMLEGYKNDLKIDYLDFVDDKFKVTNNISNNSIFLLAAKIGSTRLLDNLFIDFME